METSAANKIINIKSYRVAIAAITIITVLFTHTIRASLTKSDSFEYYILIYTIIYTAIIWAFNLSFYSLERKYLTNRTYIQKFIIRSLLTIILGITIVFIAVKINPLLGDISQAAFRKKSVFIKGFLFDVLVLITVFATDLLERTQKAELENQKLLNQNLSVQLQLLKQQIKPHFLFNSLTNLKSLVKEKDERAEEFIIHLSELYRYLLQTKNEDKVTLIEDLKILESYIFMLKTRFEDNIGFFITIDEKLYESYIPLLTFQALVENCVKHNIISKDKPLKVSIYNSDNKIIVKNNLQEKKVKRISNHIGLSNLKKRYLLISGKEIEINKTENEFIVSLPVI